MDSHFRQENDLHHWTQHAADSKNKDVLLSERDNTIWICANKLNVGLPQENTSITGVWDDTGISIHETGLPWANRSFTIREGKLSPLAVL